MTDPTKPCRECGHLRSRHEEVYRFCKASGRSFDDCACRSFVDTIERPHLFYPQAGSGVCVCGQPWEGDNHNICANEPEEG